MEENKLVKVSLSTVICMFIILILIFALIIMYYFGFVADRNKTEQSNSNISLDTNINSSNENISDNNVANDNVSNDITIELEPSNYVIQFEADLLGENFESCGNEIKGCNYEISFLDNNKFTANMNFGNSIQGTYIISNDNVINCIITSASGEYSPTQEVDGKISFKINSDSEIEIIDIPESYTIKISELGEAGWVLTDENKEMGFWPLVEGIKFVSDK